MTWLLLLRHAQSAWNAEGRWQGWADPPLSAEGQQQALAAGAVLRSLPLPAEAQNIDAVMASDLQRAQQTAALLARGLHIDTPIGAVADLKERHVGAWTGWTVAEIEQRWPGQLADWRAGRLSAPPEGEPQEDFDRRLTRGLTRLGESWAGRCLVVVTHGGALGAIARLVDVQALPSPVVNLSGFWLHIPGPATQPGLGTFSAGPTVALLDGTGEATGEAAG